MKRIIFLSMFAVAGLVGSVASAAHVHDPGLMMLQISHDSVVYQFEIERG